MTMNRKVSFLALGDAGLTDLVIRAATVLILRHMITTCANHERLASIGCELLERLFVGLIARITV